MTRRRLPQSLQSDEPERLTRAARSPRDRLLLRTGLFLGVRVAELVGLRVEDVDLVAAVVQVRRGKGDRDRAVPIPAALLPELRAWLDGRAAGWLFPSPVDPQQHLSIRAVQRMVGRCRARAGIARAVTPHKLRHSFAVALLRSGADIIEVRDLLGHASVATTQVYLSATSERLRAAVDRL
jgi:site-specific recombinase XerD